MAVFIALFLSKSAVTPPFTPKMKSRSEKNTASGAEPSKAPQANYLKKGQAGDQAKGAAVREESIRNEEKRGMGRRGSFTAEAGALRRGLAGGLGSPV